MRNDYGQAARWADLVRAHVRDADSERADWTGNTPRARFEGAREADRRSMWNAAEHKR